jgi:hypothetical protein
MIEMTFKPAPTLASAITRAASKQTYYTVFLLVDRDRVQDAFQAYAYFRWLDDRLDRDLTEQADRLALVQDQSRLVDECYRGIFPEQANPEERFLVDLIRADREKDSGLQSYIRNMMSVMAFDAERKGRLVSRKELSEYTCCLATAVTEALHYFVGHRCCVPHCKSRYLAASGAHIAHMLRDTLDDNAAGYFNIPYEYLKTCRISPDDVCSPAYRAWVASRVRTARDCFAAGKDYLALVKNLRCRIAGHAYIARFEGVLDAIEREGYRLRADYSECTPIPSGVLRAWVVLRSSLKFQPASPPSLEFPYK